MESIENQIEYITKKLYISKQKTVYIAQLQGHNTISKSDTDIIIEALNIILTQHKTILYFSNEDLRCKKPILDKIIKFLKTLK
jgi:uncharacterized protein YukJ